MDNKKINLKILPDRYAIAKLPAWETVPDWTSGGDFVSVTRHLPNELSIVCRESNVPKDTSDLTTGWRCFRVDGKLDFSLVGILSRLLQPLADAGISVFTISTFDTDFIFVRESHLEKSKKALESVASIIG